MSLWAWIAEFPLQNVATVAIPATEPGDEGELSQLSQLSQGVADLRAGSEGAELSQLPQLSQGFGNCVAHDDDAREAFEERAAIMEYDGGMTRAEAERAARQRHPSPESPAEPARDGTATLRRLLAEWGDLRPCTWCRNLTRSGRCLAAWRGELRASRDWGPTFPGQPQRCIGYRPKADDPDRTPGRERWPELVAWQTRESSTSFRISDEP